jgi:hypothetical protein
MPNWFVFLTGDQIALVVCELVAIMVVVAVAGARHGATRARRRSSR